MRVEVQVYGKVRGGDKFDQASWVVIDPKRARDRLVLTVDPKRDLGPVADGTVGLSQGGGVSDYEEATAEKLQQGGFNEAYCKPERGFVHDHGMERSLVAGSSPGP